MKRRTLLAGIAVLGIYQAKKAVAAESTDSAGFPHPPPPPPPPKDHGGPPPPMPKPTPQPNPWPDHGKKKEE